MKSSGSTVIHLINKEEHIMLEQLSSVLSQHKNAFHEQIPRYRQNRYMQIVVLRETKSHAIFTTEGQTLDVERPPGRNS